MKTFVHIIVLFIAIYWPTAILANTDCNALSGMPMYGCFADKLAASEKRVSALYRKMIGSMPQEYRELLKRSQSTWLAYRDAQCAFQFAADDPRRETPCRLQMTEERERVLKEEMTEECNGCIPYKR